MLRFLFLPKWGKVGGDVDQVGYDPRSIVLLGKDWRTMLPNLALFTQ
jgi:hypothetical protein